MMKYIRVVVIFSVFFMMMLCNSGNAKEPQKPDVNKALDSEKESAINRIMNLPPKEAFEQVKSTDFLINEDLLHKAIFKTYGHRKTEGINLALNCLKLPVIEMQNGKLVADRTADFYVAKKILEVFPSESVGALLMLYKKGDAVTKGNIIRASGNIAGGQRIRSLLIKALDDKTFCEKKNPEMEGERLRICDQAYNQLVLRYKVKNVLRTVGNAYTIEDRDYHINILKKRLEALD
jgi:hypothetical protein